MVNFRSINASAEDVYAYKLAKLALGSTFSSRLFVKLREEYGLVYAVYVYNKMFAECGLNSIHFISNAKNAKQVLTLIKEVLDKVKSEGFTEDELNTYKNIYKTSLTLSGQTLMSKASLNLNKIVFAEKYYNLDEELENIDSITLQQMNEAFNKYFDYKHLTIGVVAKEDDIDAIAIFQE